MSGNDWTWLAAWAFGLFGIACLSIWPLFRTRGLMLSVQLASLVGLALHYAFLGVVTAATVNALGVVQAAVSLRFGARPDLRWISYALAAAMVASSVVTWQGPVSLLSALGQAVVAIGRVQTDAGRMRVIVLASCPLWFAHDVIIGSPVAVADALSFIVGVSSLLWRHVLGDRARVSSSRWRHHRTVERGEPRFARLP